MTKEGIVMRCSNCRHEWVALLEGAQAKGPLACPACKKVMGFPR